DSTSTKYDQAKLPGLRRQVCALAVSETPDYDTARQLAWAFRVIYSEWSPKPMGDAKITEKLNGLDEQLKLHLPSGRDQQILDQLSLALTKISDYDPVQFRQTFEELTKLLPAK